MNGGVFSGKAVLILGLVCGVSLLVGLGLAIFNDGLSVVRSTGADTFSYSALGHHGFKSLLEDLGIPVLVSRSHSGLKARHGDVLVIAEPDLVTLAGRRLDKFAEMCDLAEVVLVVLPKRQGLSDPARPTHLSHVSPLPKKYPDAVVEVLGVGGVTTPGYHSRDRNWDAGAWSDRPFIEELQLVDAENVEPILACEMGTLFGKLLVNSETRDEHLYLADIFILTDPDLLANHGLGKGQNAALAVKIMDYLRSTGGQVVFDETLHGFEVSPSAFQAFFRVPLVFILLQALLTGAALLWLANARFGSPRSEAQTSGPARGLDFLLDNTADLLAFGGHGPFLLGRYFRSSVAGVCRNLHLDLPGSHPDARQRLINISTNRSPDFDYKEMEKSVPALARQSGARNQEILNEARKIHRWLQEMSHGR
jgi:hypothetical protein